MEKQKEINKLKKEKYVLYEFVRKSVKSQYRGSVFGILWTVLNPLLNMLVMWFVFGAIFSRGIEAYPIYLLIGNITFNFMTMSTRQSLECIVNNAGLLNKIKISYEIFPISEMCTALVNWFFSFLALLIVMIIYQLSTGTQLFYATFPLIFAYMPAYILFNLGLSFVLAGMYVFFRDIKHFYAVFCTLWMYATPIFYRVEDMIHSPIVVNVLNLNPMKHFVECFRNVLMYGIPDFTNGLIIYVIGIIFFFMGILIFRSQKKNFILYL